MNEPDFETRIAAHCLRTSQVCSAAVIGLGISMCAAWVLDAPLLHTANPRLVPMAPNSAVLFAILGIGLWNARPAGSRRARVGCALAVVVVAVVTFAEDLLAIDFGIDRLLTPASIESWVGARGRMSPATAVGFALSGSALLVLDRRARIRASEVFGLGVVAIATVALLGHLYGAEELYTFRAYAAVSLQSAVGLALSAIALFAARPREGLCGLFISPTGPGEALRRFLPVLLLAPVALGWLVLRGEQAEWFDARLAVALLITGTIGLLSATAIVLAVQRASALDRQKEQQRRADETALRESEARYRDLYENSPDMYVSVDPASGAIVDCNQTLVRELGYAKHELIGLPVGLLAHSDSLEWPRAAQAQFEATGELHDAEAAVQRKDGSKLDVSVNVASLRDADGRIVIARCVWRDITARKQADRDRRVLSELSELLRNAVDAEDAMARVAERLAQHLKATRCLFAEIDTRSGVYTVRRDYHGSHPSLRGEHPLSVFDPGVIAELCAGRTIVNHDARNDPRSARRFDPHYQENEAAALITVPLRFEGELVAVLSVVSGEPRVWQDREVSLVQMVAERTFVWLDQLRAGEALRQSEARKGAILDSSFDAIVSIDHRGVIAEFNPAAERLFGFRRGDVIGRPMAERIVPPELREAHHRGLAHYLETGVGPVIGRAVELPALRADGSEFRAEIAITAVEGETPLFTASIREASRDLEAHRAELVALLARKQSESDAVLQEVHRRVGDNLGVIASVIEMKAALVRDAAAQRALAQSHGRVVALARIHEELQRAKDLSRVPFSDYARSLAGDLLRSAPEIRARVTLDFALDEVALPIAVAIPCGLLLNELVANGLEHAFPDSRTGTLAVALSWQGSGRVRLAVTDDGVGLPAGFDVQQCDSLGMQLVCALVRQLHAQIAVERGTGASFVVTVPVAG